MAQVIRFPLEKRIDRISADAVRNLVSAGLIPEAEAVRTMRELGAPEEEIDIVRAVRAVRRNQL